MQNFYPIKLITKRQLAGLISEFRFEKPADFRQKAGQFAQFQIPSEGAFVLRSYSISSAPSADWLEFCIKLVPGGKGSDFLSALNIGDQINISAPRGLFIKQDNSLPQYFIATGTGIAPLMAMIEDESGVREIDLLFGVRNDEDVFWVDRFESVKAKNSKFNYRIALSRGSDGWAGLRGRVTEHLKIDITGHYYLCGKMEMVKDVREILLKNGVNTKNVHFEIF